MSIIVFQLNYNIYAAMLLQRLSFKDYHAERAFLTITM